MLSSGQKQKLEKGYKWKNTQERSNFYKNKRNQLRTWLDKLPDMFLILNSISPEQTKNIKLEDKLFSLIRFTDAFLETIAPLPVETNEYGEKAIFDNIAIEVDEHPDLEKWEKMGDIRIFNGKKYIVNSDNITANRNEEKRCELLKNHINRLQKYVNPAIVRPCTWEQYAANSYHREVMNRWNTMRTVTGTSRWLKANAKIPTDPPVDPLMDESPK